MYRGYGIGLDSFKIFITWQSVVKSAIIFGVDMCPSVHIDNKNKDKNTNVLILCKG